MPWTSIPEPDLVPYQALSPLPLRSLLVLAPHADDEVLGCGGLLALAVAQGADVRVVVATDGAAGGNAAERERESRDAALALGLDGGAQRLQFWRLPDRGLQPDDELVARIRQQLQLQCPDWVLAPSPLEVHPDHRALCLAAVAAAAGRCPLGFYEVGQPLLPNMLVDITPVLARKRAALACFTSQLVQQRYDEQLLALNRYRAYTLGPAVSHAEALWFPGIEDSRDAAAVLRALNRLLARRMGLD
jgi:LmbE family N-acetylglucosaminyl deacetylase